MYREDGEGFPVYQSRAYRVSIAVYRCNYRFCVEAYREGEWRYVTAYSHYTSTPADCVKDFRECLELAIRHCQREEPSNPITVAEIERIANDLVSGFQGVDPVRQAL